MKNKFFIYLSLFSAAVIFITPLALTLYHGDTRAGAGATIFGAIPGAVLFLTLFIFYKIRSHYLKHTIIMQWSLIIFSILYFNLFVRKMDHWPFGLAALLIFAGGLALLGAGVFTILHLRRNACGRDVLS